jgi:cobalt-zinc-cadmium efflux system outer membrane protein
MMALRGETWLSGLVMRVRMTPISALLRARKAARWCHLVCLLTLGCRSPVLNQPQASPVIEPGRVASVGGNLQAEAGLPEPAPLQSNQQVTRLPPILPATLDAKPNNETGIRLAAAYAPLQSESPARESLPAPVRVQLSERLKIPSDLPGANAPPIRIPSQEVVPPGQRNELIDELFPKRPLPPKLAAQVIGPTTLKQIEELSLANNPEMVQALADVTSAMGNAIQAGVHPNPTLGYEADTVGSAGTRNYQGVFGTQTIKTAGKLGLARAVANMDLMNAQLAVRRTRFDLLSRVKAAYYAVLIAQQSVAITSAMAWFTNEAYRIQVDKLRGGESPAYEPAQLRALAAQARAAQVQAQNQYISSWKQLTALIGLPDMPTAELEGRADAPAPVVNYDMMLARVLNNHPDVLAGRNLEAQARLQLQLDRVIPVPDVQLYGTFQRDFTTPGSPRTTYNVQFGLPIPIFDRNRGNIMSAEGDLRRAAEQVRRVRNELTTRSADAFGRLASNRYLVQSYRDQILPDLGRAYVGVYNRHQQEPDAVGFGDIIVAQQNLAAGLATYIGALTNQWTAVADIANLMQAEDLSELNSGSLPRVEVQLDQFHGK